MDFKIYRDQLFIFSIITKNMSTPFEPDRLDLIISTVIVIFLPFIAGMLFQITGALLPMLIYYGLAWGIVKWRRGSTGYFNKFKKKYPWSFFLNLIIILISMIFIYLARITYSNDYLGVLLTAFIWAPINAASEQLLWIYIFESWDLYPNNLEKKAEKNNKKGIYLIIGLILFTIFVGTIHTFFWTLFLQTVDSASIFGIIFVILTSLSGFIHIIVWRQSNQMILTFIPHFVLNFIPTFLTGYSIVIYLVLI